jgi:hypothetical protein
MRTWKRVLSGVAVLAVGILAFSGWYKIHYSMTSVREFEVNNRSIEPKVLVATQGSAFKDSIVRGVVEHLNHRPAYVKVIDVAGLNGVNETDWDAIVVIHTWEMHQPQVDAKRFIERVKNTRKIIVMGTSGAGTFKMEGIDAISSASIMTDVSARVAEIDLRLDGILAKHDR